MMICIIESQPVPNSHVNFIPSSPPLSCETWKCPLSCPFILHEIISFDFVTIMFLNCLSKKFQMFHLFLLGCGKKDCMGSLSSPTVSFIICLGNDNSSLLPAFWKKSYLFKLTLYIIFKRWYFYRRITDTDLYRMRCVPFHVYCN